MKDRHKAMHQGTILFLFYYSFFGLFTLSSMVDHLCICVQRGFVQSRPLSRMTLLLFNSHTLIFVSFLGPNAEVSGLMFDCPQGLCVLHQKKSHVLQH